jgi:DNA-binding SARP family transcriptional activator/class 3 adenylate cyclase/energy-coupling factor transporter ATP-binding protein EcfA2
LDFRILGPLQVLDDNGRPLALGGAKQRSLLAVLLLHAGRVVSTDRLIDELWGEDPPDTARGVLQVYVANLRKVLDPARPRRAASSLLKSQPPGYLLDLAAHAFDLARFEWLTAEGRAALAAGDTEAAAVALRRALGLWRGPVLGDVAAELTNQGVLARLEEQRLAALEQRIEADLALGHHMELVGELEALITAHPLREQLRGQLMVALYRSGRQAEALDVYRQTRETLAEELGIDPSRALQDLQQAVLAQDPALAPPAPARHPTEAPVVRDGPQGGELAALSPTATGPPVAACHQCGRENPGGFERCSACGASLAPGRGTGREERKLITVLACELVGPSDATDAVDPEDLWAGLRPYQARIRGELERYGGRVERIVGPGFMAVFGAPVAHEDDPERAVRAALAIRDTLAEFNETRAAPRLQIQIGITTGEALVAASATLDAGEATITGTLTANAAQLQQVAPPGTVLIDEATYRATTHAVTYQRGKPVRVSGAARLLPTWQPMAARSTIGAELARQPATPFIGRQDELDLLKRTYARTVQGSAVHLVTITGEPGVGKSRLVREFAGFLDAQEDLVTWRQGRCLPYGDGIAFWALGEVIKAEAGILESDDPQAAAAKLAAAVAAAVEEPSEQGWFATRLAPLVGLGGQSGGAAERSEAFTAWRSFLEALAVRRPLVLVVEDLHWADEALLAFLEHLLEWASPVPLLLVCTARPELYDQAPGWGGGARNATTITLSSLSDEEIARLLSTLLAQSVLPAELQHRLLIRAGGNPLYAEEFIRLLTDRKLLERRGRTLHLAEGAELPVPQTLQALIASRLDALSPEHKALLQDAAVLGQVFWSGALAGMSQVDEQPLHQALRVIARKELVRPIRRSSVAGQAEYAFWHGLVRDVAYGQLPRAARADKHRRAAEWLQALSPDRVEERAELLAHHWQAALRFARAAGQDTAILAERARVALREAGDRALTLHAFAAAARWYAAALELWPADDRGRPRVLLRLGQSRFYAEQGGADELAEAREGLLAVGDREAAAEAEVLLSRLARSRGLGEATMQHARHAAKLLQGAGSSRAKASVLVNLTSTLMNGGHPREAIQAGREAVAVAEELGLEELRGRALNYLGCARFESGDPGGVADLEQAVAIAVHVNSPDSAAAYGNLANVLVALGDLTRAFALQAKEREATERFALAGHLQWSRVDRIHEDYWKGRWDAALRGADEFLAESEAASPHFMEVECRLVRGRIRLARSDRDGALQDAAAAGELAKQTREPQALQPALAFQARAVLAAGGLKKANEFADELLSMLARQRAVAADPHWSGELAIVLQALGRGPELVKLAARTTTPTPWLRAATAAATAEFAQAANLYGEIGSRPDQAYASLRAAQQLVAGKQEIEASKQLERALVFYREVRASAYLREAEALLAAPA